MNNFHIAMQRKLPPLNSLRTFEVAARNLSFSVAAEELCVTQSAVSKQIRVLEEYIGVKLFRRFSHHIEFTEKGREFYRSVAKGFYELENAVLDVMEDENQHNTIKVNVLPSFSSCWLVPRLESFAKKHPKYKVNVSIGDGNNIDFALSNADIVIRGSSVLFDDDTKATPLMDEQMILIGSPKLLESHKIESMDDIAKVSFIEHSLRENVWRNFLKENDISHIEPKNILSLEHFFMIMEAVERGMGVALVPELFVRHRMKEGQIIHLLNKTFNSNYKYSLYYPKEKQYLEKIKTFKHWIKSEI